MSTAAFLQRCIDAGVPAETAIRMAAAFEATADEMVRAALSTAEQAEEARKRKQRERKQRSRSRDVTGQDVTERDGAGQDVTPPKTKVSPTPPSKTQPPLSPPTGAHSPKSTDFDQFWLAYPRKVGKGASRAKWPAAIRKAEPAEIMAGLERSKLAWRDLEPQFIPHPATYLAQERWLDEPMATGPPVVVARVDEDFIARQRARLNTQ